MCDIECPKCGAQEIANPEAPQDEQRLNIRAYKVEQGGRWYSECLPCKERTGNGWFS